MDACETGAWRPAYRLSEARRHVRAELAVRDALVRTRTRYIALAKALVRRDGLRVPTSASAWVPTRIAELELSPTLTTERSPLFAVFAPLTAQIAVADARIAAFVNPGGHLKFPQLGPGQTPPANVRGTAGGYDPFGCCARRAAASLSRQLLPSNLSKWP